MEIKLNKRARMGTANKVIKKEGKKMEAGRVIEKQITLL